MPGPGAAAGSIARVCICFRVPSPAPAPGNSVPDEKPQASLHPRLGSQGAQTEAEAGLQRSSRDEIQELILTYR